MQDSDPTFSLSSLICEEDDSCLNGGSIDRESDFDCPCPVSDSDVEFIEMMIERDIGSLSGGESVDNSSSASRQSWLKLARLEAANWILTNRAIFGFKSSTAYLSMLYFDHFMDRTSVAMGKTWAIRLLSVACLALAAKVEENKAPALSQYHVDDYHFAGSVIQRMELLVLNTLEWKMNLMTPFSFVHYFVTKFCGELRPTEIVPKAVELIVDIMREVNLVERRASFIAAASVLAAYDHKLTRKAVEFKTNMITSWGCLEKEHVFDCYNMIQEMDRVKSNTPKSSVLPNPSLHGLSPSVPDKPSTSIAIRSKRRLIFDDNGQDWHSKKINQGSGV
ncbi:unnamed protein product [Cuscuta campestris]|uniref:Uncharacterized protein n=1 Tax=Cuscuta campestris TaxID=132261 RepID=A0A484LFX9_9ASTE|nr:unnamed protein product [Cuscuta campestris]